MRWQISLGMGNPQPPYSISPQPQWSIAIFYHLHWPRHPRPDTFEINRMRDEFLEREPHFCFSKRFSAFFVVVVAVFFFLGGGRVSVTEEKQWTVESIENTLIDVKLNSLKNPMALKKGEYLQRMTQGRSTGIQANNCLTNMRVTANIVVKSMEESGGSGSTMKQGGFCFNHYHHSHFQVFVVKIWQQHQQCDHSKKMWVSPHSLAHLNVKSAGLVVGQNR